LRPKRRLQSSVQGLLRPLTSARAVRFIWLIAAHCTKCYSCRGSARPGWGVTVCGPTPAQAFWAVQETWWVDQGIALTRTAEKQQDGMSWDGPVDSQHVTGLWMSRRSAVAAQCDCKCNSVMADGY
jgi:hypothetical protein